MEFYQFLQKISQDGYTSAIKQLTEEVHDWSRRTCEEHSSSIYHAIGDASDIVRLMFDPQYSNQYCRIIKDRLKEIELAETQEQSEQEDMVSTEEDVAISAKYTSNEYSGNFRRDEKHIIKNDAPSSKKKSFAKKAKNFFTGSSSRK